MNPQTDRILRLHKAGYSLRALEKATGISKSKIQRILKEHANDEEKTSQMLSQDVSLLSQEPSQVSQTLSHELSQVSQRPSQDVSQQPTYSNMDELYRIEMKLRKQDYSLKQALDKGLERLLYQENFTLDELEELIAYLTEGKEALDLFHNEVTEFISTTHTKPLNLLKKVLRLLNQVAQLMKSKTTTTLLKDRNFKFDIGTRLLEDFEQEEEEYEEYEEEDDYDEEPEDDENEEEEGYQSVLVIHLFERNNEALKKEIEVFVSETTLGYTFE